GRGRKRVGEGGNGLRGELRADIEGDQASVFADIVHGGRGAVFDHDERTRKPGQIGESAVVDRIERSSLPSSFNIRRREIVDNVDAGRTGQRCAKSHPARGLALKADKSDGVPSERKALKEMLDRVGAERDQVLFDPDQMTAANPPTQPFPLLW